MAMADRTMSYAAQEQDRKEQVLTVVSEINRQEEKYSGLLPSNVKWDDFRNAFLIAVQTRPSLLEADRASLWLALQKCAAGGLKPDGVEAALVIFGDDEEDEEGNVVPSKAKGKKKVVYMPMVWGITKQMRNTGNVASIRCKVIYRGERVIITDENGAETYKHTRVIEENSDIDETDVNIVGAYAVVTYKDGFWDAEFMSRKQINRVQAAAKAKRGPWATHFPQQAMKTPLRRLSLRVEKSAENMRYFDAVQNDETLNTIDGDAVTEMAPTQAQVGQDQSIRQEFTNTNNQGATVDKSGRQPNPKPAAKTQPATGGGGSVGGGSPPAGAGTGAANPASGDRAGGSGGAGVAGNIPATGKPASDPDEDRRAMEREQAASAGQSVDVQIWPADDNGEPLDGLEEPMSAAEFADWIASRLFLSKSPDALLGHNEDNIGECRAVPAAFTVISDAIGRHTKAKAESEAAAAKAAKAAAEKAAAAAAPKKRAAIEVPKTPKGALHWGNYGPLCFDVIAGLVDEADILDWIAANQPTYQGKSVEIAIENRIRTRRAELAPVGTGTPARTEASPPMTAAPKSSDDLPIAVMTDDEFESAVKAQIPLLNTDEDILAWCAGGAMVGRMDDLRKRDKARWERICGLIDVRRVEISPPEHAPPQ